MSQRDFDLFGIELQGCHLIEASAGTGKTYSLALLALRQLLEAKMPVRQVLMVTFTRAAVAELEKRVRLFVKAAADLARGITPEEEADPNILRILHRAVDLHDAPVVAQLLTRAQASLDELSIYTIDSFCKRMLDDFAFETNQLFGVNLSADPHPFLQKAYYQCWRQLISQQPASHFAAAGIDKKFTYNWFCELMLKAREGKLLLGLSHPAATDTAAQLQEKAGALLNSDAAVASHWAGLEAYFTQHQATIASHLKSSRAGKAVKEACTSWEEFAKAIEGKGNTDYAKKSEQISWLCEAIDAHQTLRESFANDYFWALSLHAVQVFLPWLNQELLQRKTMLFSDLVQGLLAILQGEDAEASHRLRTSIRDCFGAVFIDEFQDTSRAQFQLFYQLFGQDKALYFIGDPKQSIYGFRQADIFTYLEARSLCTVHVMNTNYRSSKRCVDALNQFFAPEPGFDAFGFGGEAKAGAERIDYHPVEGAPGKAEYELLGPDGLPHKALLVHASSKVGEAIEQAANALHRLLTEDFRLQKKGLSERVRPGHIGVLVRSRAQGQQIKQALAQRGIPAVFVQDAKVLSSQEAGWMALLLEAMTAPSTPQIRRALLHSFANYRTADLLQMNDAVLLERFRHYEALLRQEQKGVYPAIAAFVADFQIVEKQLTCTPKNERCLTNLFQVAELLHKAARRRQLSPEELVSWLRKVRDQGGEDMNEANPLADEFTQRMESDEEAIRIMTIHLSKGLEFPIVCGLGLDLGPSDWKADRLFSWRSPGQQDQQAVYYVADGARLKASAHAGLAAEQERQENLRLLYVALTRTVFSCFVFRVDGNRKKQSILAPFVAAFKPDCPHIAHGPACWNAAPVEGIYQPATTAFRPLALPPLPPAETIWRLYSYSSLKLKERLPFVPVTSLLAAEYDQFVFRQLPRGKEHGVLFHSLMEKIDFTQEDRWGKALELFPIKAWDGYLQLLHHLVHTALPLPEGRSMVLSTLAPHHRLNELQFHLPLDHADAAALQALSQPDRGWQLQPALSHAHLQGMLEGVVDLFFEHEGRYYILDWKTDFLGDDLAAYSQDSIGQAMTERNYHLQALLYTVALHRYLQQRLPGYAYEAHFGGHVYVFVRGVRQGQESGVFSKRLPAALVAQAERILCGKKRVVAAG